MAKILINDGISNDDLKILKDAGHECILDKVEQDDLASHLNNYDAILVRSATKVRSEHIEAAPSLKLIGRGGVGLDNIDVEFAKKAGIEVVNTPGASSDSVAELALAHMFAICRFIPAANVTMRKGEWNKKAYKGIELAGKTLGVVGAGRIGLALAKKAIALGMKVIVFRRSKLETDLDVQQVTLDEILTQSDFISLHVPATGEPIINAAAIAKMKDGASIINCARGGVVDEDALCDALDSGKLWGAGVDVFVNEPTDNTRLVNHPMVSVTPHIGAATSEAQGRVGLELAQKVVDFFAK